jgi:hypothetical protein
MKIKNKLIMTGLLSAVSMSLFGAMLLNSHHDAI